MLGNPHLSLKHIDSLKNLVMPSRQKGCPQICKIHKCCSKNINNLHVQCKATLKLLERGVLKLRDIFHCHKLTPGEVHVSVVWEIISRAAILPTCTSIQIRQKKSVFSSQGLGLKVVRCRNVPFDGVKNRM